MSYLTPSAENNNDCKVCLAQNARDAFDWLPVIGQTGNAHALSFSLSQLMVTPENIQASGPVYEDLPYVGYLSGSVTLWSWNSESLTGYGIGLGVVGPSSGAEVTQKWVHKLTGSTNPNGWDNQLGTDVIGELHAFHARRLFRDEIGSGMHQEMAWVAGGRLSNFISSGELGVSWRIGANLPANIIPDYAGASSTIGLPGSLNAPGPGWSAFIGLGIEAIPYSYLDEQSGRYDYDQRPLVGLAGVGAGWHSSGIQVAITLRATTSQVETNKDALSFGTISATYRF
ncbi:lipid A deacylase LpxR family protein [Marinobacter sp. ATCH36]|nr:lipid A deacylase LpxR family protein [Marinobacter sp. ATCH36]